MSEINIIVATHGHFGEELLKSAEMIVGKMENVRTLSLLPELSFEDFMRQADELLAKTEKPVIVLVDLYGGTPCNVMTVLSKKYHHDVVTGVNLPMLINLCAETFDTENINTENLALQCIETLKECGVHTNKQLNA